MSITVSTSAQICNSQLNNSKSKSLYSFPKSKRFIDKNKTLCDAFYEKKSTLSSRQAAMGYGTKSDFTIKRTKTPAPNGYLIKAELEVQKEKNSGWSFGESRQKMKGSGIFKEHLQAVPGPGTYNKASQLSDIKYTMRQKTLNPSEYTSAKINPGPGQYEKYETIRQKGNLFVSKYKSSGACNINPAQSQRFLDVSDNKVPGPGNYSQQMFYMNKDGKYGVSKLTNSMCRSFGHDKRHGIMEALQQRIKVPGVGNYRLPSEFGYYENAQK